MSRYRIDQHLSLRPSCWRVIAGLGAVLTLSACVSGAGEGTLSSARSPAAERPTSVRSQALIGQWGVASFRQEKDRQRVAAQARAQCKLPYKIASGPTGGGMMHVEGGPPLDEPRPKGGSGRQNPPGLGAPPRQ